MLGIVSLELIIMNSIGNFQFHSLAVLTLSLVDFYTQIKFPSATIQLVLVVSDPQRPASL